MSSKDVTRCIIENGRNVWQHVNIRVNIVLWQTASQKISQAKRQVICHVKGQKICQAQCQSICQTSSHEVDHSKQIDLFISSQHCIDSMNYCSRFRVYCSVASVRMMVFH